ncbi:MAG TPA: Na+/H+ antiporter subunit E [Solirubrobacteraceae bacterium]|jgi:multicomponent Na+:H+ antiporter subunit E|nr:Na+/H+ antiporter subunit E [Solirubrobacteraceae bacterium]
MTGRVLALAALVAVWLLTLASAGVEDAALGVLLAAGVALGLRPPPLGASRRGSGALARIAATPRLLAVVLADIVHGTWDVALRVLRLRPLDRPGLVLIPIGERTELGIAATGLLFGLSPGSVLIEVDHERRAMVWHVIDARDPEAVRARFARFYDRYQRPVIP